MCDFHSICVRRDGELIHVRENSHSKAVEKFGWTENDSVFKKKRFVECEWSGYGEYPGAEKVSRFEKEDVLTAAQIQSINSHYKLLQKALEGDENAFDHFLNKEGYEDVVDQVIQRNNDPKLIVKLLCDKTKIVKRVDDHIKSGAPNHTVTQDAPASTAGNYAPASTAGNYAPASTAGYRAPASTAGDGAPASTAGDGAPASTAGNYAPASTAGNYAPASTAGNYAPASTAGVFSTSACLGYNGKAKAGKDSPIILTWWDGKRNRIKVGYTGEDLKENQWYKLDNKGNFVEITE